MTELASEIEVPLEISERQHDVLISVVDCLNVLMPVAVELLVEEIVDELRAAGRVQLWQAVAVRRQHAAPPQHALHLSVEVVQAVPVHRLRRCDEIDGGVAAVRHVLGGAHPELNLQQQQRVQDGF